MISALDSSVILDVVTDDPVFAESSERALRKAAIEGRLVACECVMAEIYPAFGEKSLFEEFLAEWQLEFVPASKASALLAGEHFAAYLKRGGKQGRMVVDFLIGAHARTHADRLVARDRGYLRDYFEDLVVLDPAKPIRP
jgi:predicted nucleic acid-binding protein